MTPLQLELDRYLTIRRSLGFDLGTSARILRRFVAFAEDRGARHVTPQLFVDWQEHCGAASPQTRAARLGVVRLFTQWLHALDPEHVPPPANLIPFRGRRPRPYIYSMAEIEGIVREAAELPSVYGLRGLVYATLFGLIAVTGLRINEALGLDNADVDLAGGVLTIRRGKQGKARLVPLAPSAVERPRAYALERDRLLGGTQNAFFVAETARPVSEYAARYNYSLFCQRLGLRAQQRFGRHGRGPRIHDLRHSFAVRTLISWYRAGLDPQREMIKLTTYLGHTEPEHTYWYIEAVPELLELATQHVVGDTATEVHPWHP